MALKVTKFVYIIPCVYGLFPTLLKNLRFGKNLVVLTKYAFHLRDAARSGPRDSVLTLWPRSSEQLWTLIVLSFLQGKKLRPFPVEWPLPLCCKAPSPEDPFCVSVVVERLLLTRSYRLEEEGRLFTDS